MPTEPTTRTALTALTAAALRADAPNDKSADGCALGTDSEHDNPGALRTDSASLIDRADSGADCPLADSADCRTLHNQCADCAGQGTLPNDCADRDAHNNDCADGRVLPDDVSADCAGQGTLPNDCADRDDSEFDNGSAYPSLSVAPVLFSTKARTVVLFTTTVRTAAAQRLQN